MNDNQIVLKAYTSGTTEAQDTGLDKAQDLTFSHQYPGGMPNSMTFYVPRDVTSTWTVQGHQRIVAMNGLALCWEGEVVNIAPVVSSDAQGVKVTCAGYWATLLQSRKTHKPWADTRTDASAWADPIAAYNGGDKSLTKLCQIDSTNGFDFIPKSIRDAGAAEVGWANNDYVRKVYTAPTGQTIKRVTCNATLAEAGQQWRIGMFNHDLTVAHWDLTASGGPTAKDVTLATPDQVVMLVFQSQAGQIPPSDGTVHALVTDIVIYTETGAINAQEICKDIAALIPELSTDLSKIGAETLSLVPFINEPPRTYADALTNLTAYGDASYNKWAIYVGMSDQFSDGKPGLVLEQVPALTDYDYAVRMDDPNVSSDLSFEQNFDIIRNWIGIQYQSPSGQTIYITPDDDATLKDTASIAAYGQREEWIAVPTTSAVAAATYGRVFLGQRKDPQWTATGTISVTGSIRGKSSPVPTSQILPGKRVKIENWLNDLSGNGLTFLNSGTDYSDTDQVCTLTIGKPDILEFVFARWQRALDQQRLVSVR